MINWCSKCILPDTRPNLFLNKNRVCNACSQNKEKEKINWVERQKKFEKLILDTKKKKNIYDCVIPVSGGKDSTWQVIKCLEYGLKPLALTWKTPKRTKIGNENLKNLVNLGVDHIDFTINPKVESKFMLKTFEVKGTPLIPMHLAIYHLPIKIALNFNIPLIIWGENSAFEYGGDKKKSFGENVDSSWIKKYGAIGNSSVKDWVSCDLSEKDLNPYFLPDETDFHIKKIKSIFLGYFFKWDPKKTLEIAIRNGFKYKKTDRKIGYYEFADIDDNLISIHHWLKWYKFGFTRAFDNLSIEIRQKRIKRDQALDVLKKIGDQRPDQDIDNFCKYTNISKKYFNKICEMHRNKKIWSINSFGVWVIKKFIIKEWKWK